MSNTLAGIGGYASLMKSRKNPYDRNLASTQAVMNQMPKDGGVTGFEGLGKIPLMYQMGVDSARAREWDSQQAADEQQQVKGVMDYQQQKDTQDRKAKALTMAIDLSKTDYKAANQLLTETLPEFTTKMKFTGNDKDGWKDIEVKGEDGYTVRGWLNPQHFADLAAAKESGTLNEHTIKDLFKKNFNPFSRYETKDANSDKPTGHLVKSKTSPTGYGYLSEQGNVYEDAPTPAELHPRQSGGGWADAKADMAFYKQKSAEVRKLEQIAAQGYKGTIVIDGEVKSFDGTVEAQNAIRALHDNRKTELVSNPSYAPLVQKHDPQWLKPNPDIQGDPAKYMPLSAAPKRQAVQPVSDTKTINGVKYVKQNGQWYQQ